MVERLDPKPLDVRATGAKRVEVNSLHLSVEFIQALGLVAASVSEWNPGD
jgi:hypothetical protein